MQQVINIRRFVIQILGTSTLSESSPAVKNRNHFLVQSGVLMVSPMSGYQSRWPGDRRYRERVSCNASLRLIGQRTHQNHWFCSSPVNGIKQSCPRHRVPCIARWRCSQDSCVIFEAAVVAVWFLSYNGLPWSWMQHGTGPYPRKRPVGATGKWKAVRRVIFVIRQRIPTCTKCSLTPYDDYFWRR